MVRQEVGAVLTAVRMVVGRHGDLKQNGVSRTLTALTSTATNGRDDMAVEGVFRVGSFPVLIK
jgi:hypothetical protein